MRFPGFTDEWKEIRLSDCCSFYSGGTPLSGKSEYYGGNIPFIRSGEIHSDSTELYITEKGLKSSSAKMVKNGDLLLAMYGATSGEIDISKIDGAINQAILCINTNQHKFFFKSVWSKHVGRILNTYLQGGQGNLSAEIIRGIKFAFPTLSEQEKISDLIIAIDKRIATQNKIIEDLKKLKSAIMAIIFGKSNVTKKQWREVRLGNICERVTRRNSNNTSNLILTIAAQYGLVSQIDFFNKSVASADLSNYYLLDKGDFAYNKSYSGEYTWGAVKRLDLYPQGVLSPLYICFRPIGGIVDSDFLLYLFESKCWYREVSEICVEGARNHGLLNVSVVDFFNMKLHLPDLSEQKRIAEMMNAISDKIEHSSRLYALYNNQKTYLLSNMFI